MRVAIFGCGWVQHFHVRAIQDLGHEVVGVANHREESARAFAERYGIERVTIDWEALAASPVVDAGVVATPNALHAPQAIALLANGRHVLVEKPMATSVAECDAMIAASAGGRARLMVAHNWRFHDAVRAVRARVAAGELGRIVKTRGYGVHVGWGPAGWFTDPALAGGGALVDMGVHAIDTARYLLGDPDPMRVEAVVGTRYGEYPVDDDAILLITWSQGTNSIVESGWWQPHTEGQEAETELYGTEGYARLFPREPEAADDAGSDEERLQPMYTAQMREFLGAIEEGRPPTPGGEDGRVVMRIVEEAYASGGWTTP